MPHDSAVRPLARVARPHPARHLGADGVARRRKGRVDAARGAVLADDRLLVKRRQHELARRKLHLVRRHPALRRAALCGRREVCCHDDAIPPLVADQALHTCAFPEAQTAAAAAAAAHAAATAGARHDRRLNSAAARLLKAAEGAEHLAVASKLLRHFRKLCASVLLLDAAVLEVLPLQRDATRRHHLGRQRGEVGDGVAREEGGRDSGKEAQEELAGQRARREQLAAGGREASALVRRWR
mmetsp:Transcript_26975/g.78658  ORF Transcript_26975/g.78658 Transcript_26975/m.78658 type:complete len:241 (+) Transcript_26975:449-1171(+)